VTCEVGKRLGELDQDVGSFRYGIVNLGAASRAELDRKWAEVQTMLPFTFA
jgi:hypothetical protein